MKLGIKLGTLAELLGAELVPSDGETVEAAAEREVVGVAGMESCGPDRVTFVANPKYAGMARESGAGAIIVEPQFPAVKATTLRVPNPYLAWAKAVAAFHPAPRYAPGVHAKDACWAKTRCCCHMWCCIRGCG